MEKALLSKKKKKKPKGVREKTNEFGYVKMEHLCPGKKKKKQMTNEGLISSIGKELLQSNKRTFGQ